MTNKEALDWLLTLEESEGEEIPIYDSDVEAVKIARKAIKQIEQIKDTLYTGRNSLDVLQEIQKIVEGEGEE